MRNKEIIYPLVGIWGIKDGSGYPNEGWSYNCPTHDHGISILGEDSIEHLDLERYTRKKMITD